jgi:integral membrane sensor domain MASE1
MYGLILLRCPVTGLRRMSYVAAMVLLTMSPTVRDGELTAVLVGAAGIAGCLLAVVGGTLVLGMGTARPSLVEVVRSPK